MFFNSYCSIDASQSIVIGDDCIFGEGVRCYDHDYRFRDTKIPIYKQGYKSSPIIIEEDCWIGSNVIILKGSHIGRGSVIGSGCVVSGDIPEYSIVTQNRELQITQRESSIQGL